MTKNLNDIVIVTQARLNSERVPYKMIKDFAGTTLWEIVCKKFVILQKMGFNVLIAAHEAPLITAAERRNLPVFKRSYDSANCDTGLKMLYEWWDKVPYKYCVLVNPCLPFLTTKTIRHFTKIYMNQPYDGLFSVFAKKDYFWNKEGVMITPWPDNRDVLDTKAVTKTLQGAHALYGSKLSSIGEGQWMGSFKKQYDPALYIVEEGECLDIDYDYQFRMLEILYEQGWKP